MIEHDPHPETHDCINCGTPKICWVGNRLFQVPPSIPRTSAIFSRQTGKSYGAYNQHMRRSYILMWNQQYLSLTKLIYNSHEFCIKWYRKIMGKLFVRKIRKMML